jgi:hypothetical protein
MSSSTSTSETSLTFYQATRRNNPEDSHLRFEEKKLFHDIYPSMMGAVRTSETSVNFNQATRCNNPEASHLRFE